jgi:hypothetical protein
MVSGFAPIFESPMPSREETAKKAKRSIANGKTRSSPCGRIRADRMKKERGEKKKQGEENIFVSLAE